MRLNNRIRNEVLEKVLNRAFKKRLKAFADEKHALAVEAHKQEIIDKWPNEYALAVQMPNEWKATASGIKLNGTRFQWSVSLRGITGIAEDLERETTSYEVEFVDQRRVIPCFMKSYGYSVNLALKGTPVGKKLDALFEKGEKLKEEFYSLKNKTQAVLWSKNTKKQLLLVWPEVESLLPEPEIKTTSAIIDPKQILEINKLAGLIDE